MIIITRGALPLVSRGASSSAPHIARSVSPKLTTTTAAATTSAISLDSLFAFVFLLTSFSPALTTPTTPAVSSIRRPLYRSSFRARNIGSFVALLADHNVKLNNLAVANGPNSLLWVVLDDGSLVDEHIFLGVVPVDESVPRLDVEPLHSAAHLGGDHLLGRLLLLFHLLHLCLLFHSLLLGGLGVRVSHDVSLALMVTNFPPRPFLRWRRTS